MSRFRGGDVHRDFEFRRIEEVKRALRTGESCVDFGWLHFLHMKLGGQILHLHGQFVGHFDGARPGHQNIPEAEGQRKRYRFCQPVLSEQGN